MNKRLLCGFAATSLLLGSAARAADLPSPSAPGYAPVQTAYPPVFTWTGLYVGLNVGAGLGDRTFTSTTSGGPFDGTVASNRVTGSGVIGGGQVGYNYQIGGFVGGVETDFDATSYRAADQVADGIGGGSGFEDRISHIGTVRGRLGYTYDNVFGYVTGGFAYGRVVDNAYDGFNAFHQGSERIGWAAGAGVEYAVTPSLSVKGEYLYADLGRSSSVIPTPFGVLTNRVNNDLNEVRVGMNYRFNGLANPLASFPVLNGSGLGF